MASGPEATGLRVGFVRGVTLTRWRTAWQERLPGVPLDLAEVPAGRQDRALQLGEVDLCFVRLPLEADGLHVIRLYDEVCVAWVARDHPIALFEAVTLADLAGEAVLEEPDAAAIARVADEGAVLLVPMSVARSHSRRDLAHRPVSDAPTTTIALAWRVDAQNPWIDEFVGIVRGRTANSSRTARERAGQGDSPTPAPARMAREGTGARRPRTGPGAPRSSGAARVRRGRRR